MAAPIPEAPPVTTATLPVREKSRTSSGRGSVTWHLLPQRCTSRGVGTAAPPGSLFLCLRPQLGEPALQIGVFLVVPDQCQGGAVGLGSLQRAVEPGQQVRPRRRQGVVAPELG